MLFFDKQKALARQQSYLAGRHGAPTRGPTQWGGEGTTSREVVANQAALPRRGIALPSLHLRFITNDAGPVASIHADHEGVFLWVWPFELALLWPGVQA